MATPHDLKAVLKETLENRGVLERIRAQMRAEVYQALEDKGAAKPKLSRENFLLNELIREYLEFNEYKYTSSVLVAESGQPKESLERDFLATELGISQDVGSASVPLLYAILNHFTAHGRLHLQEHKSATDSDQDQLRATNLDHSPDAPEPVVMVKGTAAPQH